MTKQLLAYAGQGRSIKKVIDLSRLVSQSTQLLLASVPRRIGLQFTLSRDLPCVEADPGRIEQILMNLVINAGEAIPPETAGRIEVATSAFEVTPDVARKHSRAHDVAPGAYICLEVRDNGVGMDGATKARIFDPFFSTKFTGRGLGLAAVHGMVRASGGFIDVHSAPGEGSAFRIFLPGSEKERPVEHVQATAPQPALRPCTVLVVDDEEIVRKLACTVLKQHGCEVWEAENGRHALQVLADSPSLPTVVLLDMAMPVMGGDELVPILAQNFPGVKVIISSGYSEEQARNGFPPESVAGFLQKPYTMSTLAERIRQVLADSPGPARTD